MDDQIKSRLTSSDVWVRALYMIFFAIAYGVAELLVTLIVIFQFLTALFTGSANAPLLRLGRNLGEYVFEIIQFQTFNTEEKPFPFSDWPDKEPGGGRWMGDDTESSAGEDGENQPASEGAIDPEPASDEPAEQKLSESRKAANPPPL